MRQVDRDELIHLLFDGMRTWTPTLRKMFVSSIEAERSKGRYIAAGLLADRLKDLDILSQAPPPPPFRFANFEGGSGVPMVEAED
ncbi:hypothetical protein [Sphingomonas sp.]|jgi:hypothetical protein|uniref:hypothetical protein n=1 Tax=Sphingomonas sp. TaxID=28214 RepID=UPI003561A40E